METMTETRNAQKLEFERKMREIFSERFTLTTELNDEGLIVAGKLNTQEIITDDMLWDLLTEINDYELKCQINEAVNGINIHFKITQE